MAATSRIKDGVSIYQLKITLLHIKPPVWRRVEVPEDIPLSRLHRVIQVVMGWDDSHLHEFSNAIENYGPADPEFDGKDERKFKLCDLLSGEKSKASYLYDFGDTWEHEILLEKIGPIEKDVSYPRCLKGKRACPPEDCGGPWGYADFVDAITNPKSPEHDDLLDWCGGEFDPEHLDIEKINAVLRKLR